MFTPPLSRFSFDSFFSFNSTQNALTHFCSTAAAVITYCATKTIVETYYPYARSVIDLQRQKACQTNLAVLQNLRLLVKQPSCLNRQQYQSIYKTLQILTKKNPSLITPSSKMQKLLDQIIQNLNDREKLVFTTPLLDNDLYAQLRDCWSLMLKDAAYNHILNADLALATDFKDN